MDRFEAARYRLAWREVAGDDFPGELRTIFGERPKPITRLLPWRSSEFLLESPLAQRIAEVIDKQRERLITRFDGVTGVALSLRYRDGEVITDQPCLTFYVSHQDAGREIPREVEGVPTDVIDAGRPVLHALPRHAAGARIRPAAPGYSLSHVRVTSGTFGCLVRDHAGTLYALSCAHVLADAGVRRGDAIVQQGVGYGGAAPHDQIGTFTDAVPLSPGTCLADAAIAEIQDRRAVTNVIRYLAAPRATRVLTGVGLKVQKSGDETGLTSGYVTGINATIGPYSANGVHNIYFSNAIVTTGMSRGGDSGSLLLDNANDAIGLLFGGLETVDDEGVVQCQASWYTPIDVILTHFGVQLA